MGLALITERIVKLTDDTVRAPDIAVVDTAIEGRDFLLPQDVLLAVEVSNTTLATDLGRKRLDYAAAGIRHYWVVDLAGRVVHCHADPQDGDYAARGVIAFGDPCRCRERTRRYGSIDEDRDAGLVVPMSCGTGCGVEGAVGVE